MEVTQAADGCDRPLVRVVVVNFDGGDVTLRCIDALRQTRYPRDRLQIVVVDNASVDGVNWTLRERYPDVVLIESDVNEGFARGCNLALTRLDEVDFVALINNDTVVTPGWLEPLLACFAEPSVGAACPKLLLNVEAHAVLFDVDRPRRSADGRSVGVCVEKVVINGVDRTTDVRYDERFWNDDRAPDAGRRGRWSKGTASIWWEADPDVPVDEVVVSLSGAPAGETTARIGRPGMQQHVTLGSRRTKITCSIDAPVRIVNSAGGALYTGWFGGDRGFLQPDIGQFDEACEVFSWCGGAVLLRSTYLQAVGVFDPEFFLYYEDFDLSWRGRSAGWRYRYEPASVVLHEHAYSSKAGSEFFNFWVDRNRRLTLVKNAPGWIATRAVLGSVAQLCFDLARHGLSQLRRRRPPSPGVVKRRLAAFGSFARVLPHALRERRRLTRVRTVAHEQIRRWMETK